jgi:pimeloyl-ACP methyl ester carboxylesterase
MTMRRGRVRLPNGMELPYVETGSPDGDPVVFLHAYADSWRSFEPVLPWLPAGLRSVVPTQRGHGDALKPRAGYDVNDFAEDLGLLLERLGLEHAALVASSSAGFTAQRLALDRPEQVRALVLIGTPWSLRERAGSLGFVEAVTALRDPVDPAFVRDFVAGTSSDRVPAPFLEAMTAESSKVPAHVWRGALEGLLAAPPPTAGAIRVPTLLVWGDRDEILPRQDQELLLAAIPGSRLSVYDGAGHVVHWEQPERLARDVASFLAEVSL